MGVAKMGAVVEWCGWFGVVRGGGGIAGGNLLTWLQMCRILMRCY